MAVGRIAGRFLTALALTFLISPRPAAAYTVKQTDSGAIVRWHSPAVALRVDPGMDRFFTDLDIRAVISNAALAWRDLEGVPEILINEGVPGPRGFDADRAGSHGDNGIYLVEDWDLAESSLAVTVATYESRTGRIVDTDILVNANHPFAEMPTEPERRRDAYDLPGVMAHEMGHVLGLGESYEERMATMWPNIARGETHQRDLDEDDELGAQEAYRGAPLSEVDASGCGGASVVVSRGSRALPWVQLLLMAAVGLWTLAWLRRRDAGERWIASRAPWAFVLLFAVPVDGSGTPDPENERVEVVRTLATRRLPDAERHAALQQAARSRSAKVRMAAAAVLERAGSREDRAVAAKLSLDPDPEVRRLGRVALARLHSAPPRARLAADEPGARQRLKRLFGHARRFVAGEAVHAGVHMRRGLIWSRYLVHDEDEVTEVEIPGGSLGELTQVVSEQEAPADGDTLVVAVQPQGTHGWAHLRDGVVYGGWLGEGPGIEWAPERQN